MVSSVVNVVFFGPKPNLLQLRTYLCKHSIGKKYKNRAISLDD